LIYIEGTEQDHPPPVTLSDESVAVVSAVPDDGTAT